MLEAHIRDGLTSEILTPFPELSGNIFLLYMKSPKLFQSLLESTAHMGLGFVHYPR